MQRGHEHLFLVPHSANMKWGVVKREKIEKETSSRVHTIARLFITRNVGQTDMNHMHPKKNEILPL